MSQIDQNSLLGESQQNQQNSGSAAPSTGSNANAGVQAPNAQTGSGRFQNLQKYVDANKGQGENQANRLSNATTSDITAFNKDNQARTDDINGKAQEAQTLFAKNGADYTNALKGWQDSLKTQADLLNRGTANDASQQVKAFTEGTGTVGANNSDFNTFQQLQQGKGYDQQAALDSLSAGMNAGTNTLQGIQNKAKQIQTEEGRYNLLQAAATPYGAKSTMGGNRLNQLIFQADPSAVRSLQNQFTNQAGQVEGTLNNFNNVGLNTVNPLIQQELDLQNSLKNGAVGLEKQFESNFANQKNYDIVNDNRAKLYNDYVNQFNGNTISSDLAAKLGISNMGGQGYTTTEQNLFGPAQFGPAANQFTKYNTGQPTSAYMAQNMAKASTLQDVLGANDFANYKAFNDLAGTKPTLTGGSNLGSVVTNGTRDYRTDLQTADQNFRNTYLNPNGQSKTYTALGVSNDRTPVGSEAAKNTYAGLHEGNNFNPYAQSYQAGTLTGINNGASDLAPTVRAASYTTTIDKLLKNIAPILNDKYVTGGRSPGVSAVANQNFGTNAVTDANSALQQLKTQLNNTGVQNLSTLGGETSTDSYKLLKSLGLI